MKPEIKPNNPNFSSGPCSKRPDFNISDLNNTPFGRSHRSALGKEKLALSISKTKELLNIPDNYRVGIVPASDTGAVEMALWSLLGATGVDVLHWESFGKGWAGDIKSQLKLKDVNEISADYGKLPDLSTINFDNDVVFTWNGTTSGVMVPNGDWIPSNRKGLTICDATSAVFAMELPWQKLDVVTYSWQKVLGGEAAHGMLILSPRAVERLESYTPPWPLPKIFRLTNKGKLIEGIFKGATINTPSMIANEDYLENLKWVESIGGLKTMIERSKNNLKVIEDFVEEKEWINFLAEDPTQRSHTSVCLTLKLVDDRIKDLIKILASEKIAYDIASYKDAPTGLRLWCGGTIESDDLKALLPWIAWAYNEVK